jgi:2-polyprenyl-3-methyl-5-hydroxy-6-metoxy-1,4-benzoquinol methylase
MSSHEDRDLGSHFSGNAEGWLTRYSTSPSFAIRLRVVGEAIVEELKGKEHARVLDVGGGPGLFSAVAAGIAAHVLCLDPVPEMLRAGVAQSTTLAQLMATARVPYRPERITRVAGTIDAIENGQRFDLVLAIGVLEYLPDPAALLKRLVGLLAADGAVLFTVPNPSSIARRVEKPLDMVASSIGKVLPIRKFRDRSYSALRPHGSDPVWQTSAPAGTTTVTPLPLSDGLGKHVHPNLLVRISRS